MSMELGTYSQGEYTPRRVERQRVLGTTALLFSSPEIPFSSYDPYAKDEEISDEEPNVLFLDTQPSYAQNRQDFGLLRREQKSSNRKNQRRRNRRRNR